MPGEAHSALRCLLRPTAVAVVGATPRSMAEVTIRNLRHAGYGGAIYPVHPRRDEAYGLPCYPSLAALPAPVDCVVVAVNRHNCVRAMEEIAAAGIRAAVVYASGFTEDAEGQDVQRRLAEVARAAGIAVCGPNCMGLLHVPSGTMLTGYDVPPAMQPGAVAAIVQSGSVFYALAFNTRVVRFNYLISSGNEAVTDLCDHLEAVLDDAETRVVALFVEGIRRPERFLELVERAHAREVPLLALKVGRSQAAARFAIAHTGSLAGSDAVFDAVCRARGILRVHDLDEMLDAAGALASGTRLPAGAGMAAVTDSGGERALLCDLAEGTGVHFPPLAPATRERLAAVLPFPEAISNPLDAWGVGDYRATYRRCLQILAGDPAIDVVALATDTVAGASTAPAYVDAVIETARMTEKTVVLLSNVSSGQDEPSVAHAQAEGVPVLRGATTGLRVITHMAALGRFRRRRAARSAVSPLAPGDLAALRADLLTRRERGEMVLDEHTAKRVLARYGIPTARERLVFSQAEAEEAVAALGGPVALKVCSSRLPHKSEAGGVMLGLNNRAEAGAAYNALARRFGSLDDGRGVPALVQEMVEDGLETIVGLSRDPQWGLVIAFGLGGVLVELLRDVRLALPPLDDEGAEEMLAAIGAAALLRGYRGAPPRDRAALRAALLGLSALALDLGDLIEEVDVNPLLALAEGRGARAVDALLRLRAP